MLFSVAAVPGTVLGLLQSYGYVGVFVLVALESLGLPLPGETALLTAAALAAAGHLSLLAATAVGLVFLGRWVVSRHDEILAWFARQGRRIGASAPVLWFRSRHPRAWSFLTRRFSRTEYLGLHLTLGLFLSLGALWLFGGISEDVIHHDPLTAFDLRLDNMLHRHASP